ncbi:MAG: hypothetical protein HC921_03895 [Synechococcaceae cyanobacterium SM2_3_1]|nr:hypothetical protein [Synechococcaceae cyanobacterium SM2_3_1]
MRWAFELDTSSTHVIMLRHGRSTFNEQQRFQGNSDHSRLTATGAEAAYKVGFHCAAYPSPQSTPVPYNGL